jgi:hypothetical protein
MITFNLKTLLTLFCIGLLIGFTGAFLFTGCSGRDYQPAVTTISPVEIKKQAKIIEIEHQQAIKYLETKNAHLQNEVTATHALLTQIKKTTSQREKNIKQLIEPKGVSAKVFSENVKTPAQNDSIALSCDSLKQEVTAYLQENANKDSLYDRQITTMDSVIAIKDTIIQTQTARQEEFNVLFNQSIQQQEILFGENKQLRKQLRRQKAKSTFKTIGLMILSGIATHYLINH